MTKEERRLRILARLHELRHQHTSIGMSPFEFMAGIVICVFEVTAEVLSDASDQATHPR